MRIGLIAAVQTAATGAPRAELPLAGRAVLAWQAALLQGLGVERLLCLCSHTSAVVLELQHAIEAAGIGFHALHGFAALPALVRTEDDLIILRDGLVPDPEVVRALVGMDAALRRVVATMPAAHALAAEFPDDFERIDAARHWAGVLIMRGAAVQQLADFPADADPVSVLLRLALQAGTQCTELPTEALVPERWLLATGVEATTKHEAALIAAAAPHGDTRAPLAMLAREVVRRLAPRGLGKGALIGARAAVAALLSGAIAAALGMVSGGLVLAAVGAFAAQVAAAYAALAARLHGRSAGADADAHADAGAGTPSALLPLLGLAIDGLAALALWFALAPWPAWSPLAVCGPLIIGLARLAARGADDALAVIAEDRASLLLLLALAAGLGLLPEATALLALALLGGLLLRGRGV